MTLPRLALIALLGAAAMYAAAIALLWWGQERLLFFPATLPADHHFGLPADVHEGWVDVPGARLNTLHLRLPKPSAAVFFLHGNAGDLQSWFTGVDFYRRANVDVFMIDYRGYGKSSGRIKSQAQLEADVRAAWAAMTGVYANRVPPGTTALKRVIYGRSLGSGLAAMLAAEVQPDLTILVSPYVSVAELARTHYRWVPAFVLRYPLRTDAALARLRQPVVLAHGGRDALIPPEHSQRLLSAAPHAQLILVPDAGHNDIHLFDAYLNGLMAALRAL